MFVPTAARFADMRRAQASTDRAGEFGIDERRNGIERFVTLRLQRAVLAAAAARATTTPQEMKLMHDLARLSAAERRSIVTDADPGIVERMRMAMPELPG